MALSCRFSSEMNSFVLAFRSSLYYYTLEIWPSFANVTLVLREFLFLKQIYAGFYFGLFVKFLLSR